MAIIYLTNVYPAPSNTFVRDEILELEKFGHRIHRCSIRSFGKTLVDPLDLKEYQRTTRLLTGNIIGLVISFMMELFQRPTHVFKALKPWLALLRNSGTGFPRHSAYFLQAVYLRRHAERLHVSHIHVHFSTNATAVAMLCKFLGGPTYSFTVHGPDELNDLGRNSLRLKLANSEFVVAITEYCKRILVDHSHSPSLSDKIHVVRCSVDLDAFCIAPQIADENRKLVCIGRLCFQKGQIHLPEAVSRLRSDYPDIEVLLIGDGEARRDIEHAIALRGVTQHFALAGWGTRQQVREAIKAARVLVLPSYAEGLPVAIMEAMAMGRPVVSTSVAGIPELVDSSCGWLTAPGDIEGLEASLRAALSMAPARLQGMGMEGRRRVKRFHDRRQNTAALSALLHPFEHGCHAQRGRRGNAGVDCGVDH